MKKIFERVAFVLTKAFAIAGSVRDSTPFTHNDLCDPDVMLIANATTKVDSEGYQRASPDREVPMQADKIKQTDSSRKFRSVLAASTLEGDAVRNSAGEDLGKVDDIMIDIPTGRVAYAVLSFGGFLRMGNKLFAVPWSALTVDEDEKCFILDVDKGTLETAPGFDKDNWPDMADSRWATEVYRHYGARPYWEDYREEKPLRGGL